VPTVGTVTVVPDGEVDVLSITGDADVHPCRVAGVADGVRDGLLREAVDRGPHRRADVVEVTAQLDLDARPIPGAASEPLDVAHPRLRGELGLAAGPQEADHGAHLRERPRGRLLDDPQRVDGAVGVGRGDGPSRLGLDRDRRDVVGHGVVELPRQLLTLAELDLIQLPGPGVRAVPRRGAERGGERQDAETDHGIQHGRRLGQDPERRGDQHDRQPEHHLATGRPAQQRVGQHQHPRRRVQLHLSQVEDRPQRGDHSRDPERVRDRAERSRTPPRHGDRHHEEQHERRRS
jgi:hypothetical protein